MRLRDLCETHFEDASYFRVAYPLINAGCILGGNRLIDSIIVETLAFLSQKDNVSIMGKAEADFYLYQVLINSTPDSTVFANVVLILDHALITQDHSQFEIFYDFFFSQFLGCVSLDQINALVQLYYNYICSFGDDHLVSKVQ